MKKNNITSVISDFLAELFFKNRKLFLFIFAAITIFMIYSAAHLRIDASFKKNIPLEHPYMKTYLEYQSQFGGANRVLIVLENKKGDIFQANFLGVLEKVTNEVASIKGIERVSSIFTPDTRYIEVDEQGFRGGPVIDADYQPTAEGLKKVQQNVIKAGIVGRLVSNDFVSAMVSTQLLDIDPQTGKNTDFIALAQSLEEGIRDKYQNDDIKVHIIGFAKMIGDVSKGAKGVLVFFALAIFISAILVYWYSKSAILTFLPIATSIIAVFWQLGLLTSMGFGIDPMSILVPFLVFAIGVSHGVQMINAVSREVSMGSSCFEAAKTAFKRLMIPGGVALLSDTLGFLTLLLIQIDIIRELAITASLGVAVIFLTNLILLPLLLSMLKLDKAFVDKTKHAQHWHDKVWLNLSGFGGKKWAVPTILITLVLTLFGSYFALNMKVGAQHAGAPALRADSIYNKDTDFVTKHFSIGTDLISVIVESKKDSCIDYDVMNAIDDFHWRMSNVEGVQSVISLPEIAKKINVAYNEGFPSWKVLPKTPSLLSQDTGRVPTSTGLLNDECSVIPVLIFTKDHKAKTIETVIAAVKQYKEDFPTQGVNYRLASAPVGVLAATNEVVAAAQLPMLYWVYGVVIFLCLITFGSVRGTLCVIIPLAVVSILAQATMSILHIGLTVATLPVIALGVGVGVDYGIYIFSRMVSSLRKGVTIRDAYYKTLTLTGNAVIITGLTLGIAVSTWIFSDLQFQADMGILLTFMFLVNMIGAITLLPALAAILYRKQH
ncbi:MAG: multidrug RND transporter [Gammaproteobacteria bacterium CG22_combo_CG10-13_8_21_14_all_40_8]|nr:MAG: multidrug RND transporter [Gammaproteobacteria bacterium CG22_combo_CG10-13_8_21_14_all_40_8]